MSALVIQAENLSKRYRIRRNRAKYITLRDSIADTTQAFMRRAGGLFGRHSQLSRDYELIQALDEVSFKVRQGEIVGVIGRNGSGKSTLLKILSRVTEPASGDCWIHGRVGSLLEVGSGFHPELTGRENVYLNGAILGMKRREIDRKFDEIISFAEVETYIETPVKHYSSGMHMRLAFSVAAHLEPDIMLVDEVLAVGDSRFWQKSIDKMRELNSRGMTILLVTHDLGLMQTMATRALCLEKGRIVADGTPLQAISQYKNFNLLTPAASRGAGDGRAAGHGELLEVKVGEESSGYAGGHMLPDSCLTVTMKALAENMPSVRFLLRITSADRFSYFTVYSEPIAEVSGKVIVCEAVIPQLMLLPGEYCLCGAVCSGAEEEQILDEKHLPFSVKSNGDHIHDNSLFWNRAEWRFQGQQGTLLN